MSRRSEDLYFHLAVIPWTAVRFGRMHGTMLKAYTRGEDFGGSAAVISSLGEPQEPFETLSGRMNGVSIADVRFFRRLHAQQAGQ